MPMPQSLQNFFKHPDMCLVRVDFSSVAAFLQGFDTANCGTTLAGFREWLVLKIGRGHNLAWPQLFLQFAFRESRLAQGNHSIEVTEKEFVLFLGETLSQYWSERDDAKGTDNIMLQYSEWLKCQAWFQ